jgi:hypothetical protein
MSDTSTPILRRVTPADLPSARRELIDESTLAAARAIVNDVRARTV